MAVQGVVLQKERGGLRVGGQGMALPVLTCQVVSADRAYPNGICRIPVTKRWLPQVHRFGPPSLQNQPVNREHKGT
jgi:hypothetical protein